MKAELKDVLKKYEAEHIDTHFESGKNKNQEPKLRIHFSIQSQKMALDCYKEVVSYNRARPLGQTECFPLIFLVKDEATFVKYGDIAAEKYYA